ncbi:MAG TPA: hypothetical protein PKB10_11055, partial [Tepidisphaeraceae bacterium]|nr:hypothetical protein [Tepidisphaeraceae bacterium]
MIGLLLSALVTQMLLAQLARGQVTAPLNDPPSAPESRFVPGTARFAQGATLEIRTEALVVGLPVGLSDGREEALPGLPLNLEEVDDLQGLGVDEPVVETVIRDDEEAL